MATTARFTLVFTIWSVSGIAVFVGFTATPQAQARQRNKYNLRMVLLWAAALLLVTCLGAAAQPSPTASAEDQIAQRMSEFFAAARAKDPARLQSFFSSRRQV